MPKKRRKGTRKRLATGKRASSAATEMAERIAAAGPGYFEDNFIRLMQDSGSLRQEPEFADFYLDPRQLLEAASRHFPRFHRQLGRLGPEGAKKAILTYDDYRIAVLADLDTPQLRQEVRRRLEQCINRLKRGSDAEKLETALFISTLLGDRSSKILEGKKPLPLGIYGLMTVIYEDSFDQAMATIPEMRDIIDVDLYNVWSARHSKRDLAAIAAAVEQVNAFEDLASLIEADPALALAWKRQERLLIEQLQSKMVLEGLRLKPSFFTSDELILAMNKMEQRYWNKPWSLSRYFVTLAAHNFLNCIRETLDEIMPPQRMAEMIEGMKSLGQNCLEAEEERPRALVSHIQAAIHHLQRGETPSQNRVVQTIYLLNFLTVAQDWDALSPRWQQFFKRVQKSRLFRS